VSDVYIWLEDLSNPDTLRFIEEHNKRFRDFMGDLPNMFIDRVKRYYGLSFIIEVKATEEGVYAIVRELNAYSTKLIRWDGETVDVVGSRDLERMLLLVLFILQLKVMLLASFTQ